MEKDEVLATWRKDREADGWSAEFIEEQLSLFLAGVRDGRLHDACMYLIDNYK